MEDQQLHQILKEAIGPETVKNQPCLLASWECRVQKGCLPFTDPGHGGQMSVAHASGKGKDEVQSQSGSVLLMQAEQWSLPDTGSSGVSPPCLRE